ncbi:ribonuclease Z [Myroides odoratimimus]|uniref:Ribonuclease Z n=1 Tax=Myroides odoratimimus CIP 101113 TaxID=883154 RepID=A0AAV3F1A4_9FLAO|nr:MULTISPECIES: ribonuclease Z [Myroides]APA93834.1 ribonuclease Z [Myroides sp. ZB35]EHO08010.1 ribonuclease Z [Myroides odoratimimus CCUG 12901]EHO09397.1 ribonuclease Z [Myroides odoratimimus CIP 101113]EKB05726.1 ribonuclease Z [Myroides odoratimimus CCUG 3837]EPH13561.1 ribonuclease Z [Myroides odoratimimus CCUG 12700]
MKLTILGCYAATPRTITNPTSQVLEMGGHMFLIDAGEGTQVQLRRHKLKFQRINHIFISHLHGDHFYGLIGLISTYMLLNRTSDLHIYGPKGIKEVTLLQLRLSNSYSGYKLFFHEQTSKESRVVFEDDKVIVRTIPLDHRVYTNGYLFETKPGDRKLRIGAIEDLGIDRCYYQKIKSGGNITLDDGTVVDNKDITYDPEPTESYAFCSDTYYSEAIVPIIKDVDVLYHESTFLDSEEHYTERTKHCTAKQAASIAKLANAKTLILGHYSTRYNDITLFKKEAETVFSGKILNGDDGKVFDL